MLEDHGELVRHDLVIAIRSLDAQRVELEGLCRVGDAIVARGQLQLELD